MTREKSYVAIDLKSFYASVECVERGLDPLNTNLVVADERRSEKTICLAVSPSLKQYGIPGRPRLFEVVQKVKEINRDRERRSPLGYLSGESYADDALSKDPVLALSYIVAQPRMAFYMAYSKRIYEIYLKYVAAEDIHVYSIDEVFMDVSGYLRTYRMSARELTAAIIRDVRKTTGITATAGIGTNLYLCKVAMDIMAKHSPPDEDGVRIAELDEMSYRQALWAHEPITDFWRVGAGTARRLAQAGMHTMGDVARCSLGKAEDWHNEELLYELFGVNAELLIDHAWGYEPCTIQDIRAYQPAHHSIGMGQVLSEPYTYDKAALVLKEMADQLALNLVEKRLVSDQIILDIGYDSADVKRGYRGETHIDRYGRKVPRHAHGKARLKWPTSSSMQIREALLALYARISDPSLSVRRITLTAADVVSDLQMPRVEQGDLFTDVQQAQQEYEKERKMLDKEKKLQEVTLAIKKKYGKNALLRGMDLEDGAKAKERNETIGGHQA